MYKLYWSLFNFSTFEIERWLFGVIRWRVAEDVTLWSMNSRWNILGRLHAFLHGKNVVIIIRPLASARGNETSQTSRQYLYACIPPIKRCRVPGAPYHKANVYTDLANNMKPNYHKPNDRDYEKFIRTSTDQEWKDCDTLYIIPSHRRCSWLCCQNRVCFRQRFFQQQI
jgi:hypothetical protein